MSLFFFASPKKEPKKSSLTPTQSPITFKNSKQNKLAYYNNLKF